MDAINTKITEEMQRYNYRFKTVDIKHLPAVQDAVGILAREGTLNEKLAKEWQFYKNTNADFPEAKTIIVTAMPQAIFTISSGGRERIIVSLFRPVIYSKLMI